LRVDDVVAESLSGRLRQPVEGLVDNAGVDLRFGESGGFRNVERVVPAVDGVKLVWGG
jgi:hypothetical protein